MSWVQKTGAVVVLVAMTGVPVTALVCAVLCGFETSTTVSHHHHHHGASAQSEPALDGTAMTSVTPAHDCSSHEPDAEASLAAAGRAHLHVQSLELAVTLSDPSIAIETARSVAPDTSPPLNLSRSSTTSLVLRI